MAHDERVYTASCAGRVAKPLSSTFFILTKVLLHYKGWGQPQLTYGRCKIPSKKIKNSSMFISDCKVACITSLIRKGYLGPGAAPQKLREFQYFCFSSVAVW